MLLTLGIGQVWAAEYTIKATDGFKSSYNETEATFEKEGVTYGYLAAMYNANNTPSTWYKQQLIQCRKHTTSKSGGDVWNVTPLNISKVIVKLATSDKDFTLYYGSTEKPTSNSIAKSSLSATEETITYSGYVNKAEVPDQSLVVKVYTFDLQGTDASYFLLDNGNNANYIWEIIIQTTDGGGSDPDDCTAITPILTYSSTPLLTNSTATATLEGNTGNGDVTYTTSDDKIATVDANGTVTAVGAGTATITANIAAAGEYCDGKATTTITVIPLVSCSEVYNLADDATFVLKDFVVTYANGKYTYIKDDTGYGLIFKDSYGLIAGDQVASGKFEGKRDSYNGLVEIIPTTAASDLHANNGTAPEPEPMATNPTAGDMNKYVKFENVSFASTAFSSKSINGTIEGQGSSIKFYDQFATNKTFDTSKKYDVIGVVSMFNSVQVNFISAEEVAESTLNVKITNADFGKIAINGKAERTLTLNGSRLTNTVSLAIEGEGAEHFKLSSNSVDPTDGNITNAKITITYKPTAEGTHTATLKITSDDVAGQTITLTGQAAQEYTVHFYVNGEEDETLKKTVLSGNTLEELPTATSCDLLNYPTFAGWASEAIDGTTDVKPTMLDLSTPITSDCKYYAVFAKGTTSSGSTTSAIMKYTGGTTINMDDGNNATIVGLDETLFNITSTKTASGSYVGLNKNNDIRLYANKSDGNGNILTISMLDGSSITKITLDIKQEANFVVKANGKPITGADNVYTIDYPSCSIQNTTTGATTQLHLNSVTIEYTTSTTTYEYITSCAVVVPTCEITYDYADGEGECTNDIVKEGAEYTLCATDPTKAGHTFLNWKDQHGTEYAAGATITSVTEDLTLTAQWQVNSYEVTWMSLGDEVLVNSANYNTQPTKPTTAPSYTCGIGSKEFVGWTTQEIDGIGVPANLYTDEFPVVTKAITYHAVFASKIEGGGSMSKAVSLTNGETVYLATESGIGVTGANTSTNTSTNKDATVSTTQGDWMPFTVVTNGLQYQFKNGDNYITAAAKSFKITETPSDFSFENGYIVYNVPSGSDAGDYVLLLNNNNGGPFYRFYKKSNIGKENYETFYVYKNPTHTDYTTSCPVLDLTEGENTLTDGVTVDVKVNRQFESGKLYTISLPFALAASQVETIFGTGTTLYQFSGLEQADKELVMQFSNVTAIAAATPYLIKPAQNVDPGTLVEDVTIEIDPVNIEFTAGATTVTMKPILSATEEKTNGTTQYWLATDNYLYNNETQLLSLRALFEMTTVSGMPPRCRAEFSENEETALDYISTTDAPIKVIENGQLIIIRDGEMYNAQGQKL